MGGDAAAVHGGVLSQQDRVALGHPWQRPLTAFREPRTSTLRHRRLFLLASAVGLPLGPGV